MGMSFPAACRTGRDSPVFEQYIPGAFGGLVRNPVIGVRNSGRYPFSASRWIDLTFNNAGRDDDAIDPPGESRGIVLPPLTPTHPDAAGEQPIADQAVFSDWMACSTQRQAGTGAQIGTVRVVVPAQSFAMAALRGEGPVLGVQYLSATPGVLVASAGDAFAAGDAARDRSVDFVTLACEGLSRRSDPVVPVILGGADRTPSEYAGRLRRALRLRPGVVHLQAFSRHGWDGTFAGWAAQFATILRAAEQAQAIGAQVILSTGVSGGLTQSEWDVYQSVIHPAVLRAVQPPFHLLDSQAALCEPQSGARAGHFKPGLSGNGVTPNDAGRRVVARMLRTLLEQFISPDAGRAQGTVPVPVQQSGLRRDIDVRDMSTQVQEVIGFELGGNASGVQMDGWSLPEDEGCWSLGASSRIRITRPRAPFGFFLEVELTPHLLFPFRMSQALIIECDGRVCGSHTIDRPGVFAFFIPPGDTASGAMTVRFIHPSSFRPSDFRSGADRRDLAFKFKRIRVLTLASAWLRVQRPTAKGRIASVDYDGIMEEARGLTGIPAKELFSQFEMIAGNCDLGLALRTLGYEWLSLLRFAGATPEVAIRGLETDFRGAGQDIAAEIAENPAREWMVRDAFGLRFHSGQSSNDVTEAELLKRFPRYAERLRSKLAEDLDESRKIFVFADHREMNAVRSLEYVLPLYLALRRRTSAPLLWVCPARNDPERRGNVVEVLPGLAMAELDLTAPPVTIGGGITVSGWVTVLCNAWNALKRNRRQFSKSERVV